MKPFELLVIVKPGLDDEGLATCRGRVEGWLADGGGSIEESFDLGETALAYGVRKYSRGRFLLFWFQGPSALPDAVMRRLRVDEEVIRHLVVERHAAALKTIKTAGEEKEKERDRGDGKSSQYGRRREREG